MIVETAKWAEKDLPGVLDRVRPDVICVDNVILFPAIKRYAREFAKPWVRIISCSENEIEDPAIPPHLSGCEATDRKGPREISPALQRRDQADPRPSSTPS
jgi:UDP:flavonoid glycosyltransferase YjiC (YdhE family)